jgi:putative hemolysin
VNVVLALLVGLLCLVAFVGSFTCETLRGFSRSRLDEACWRIRRRERVAVILRRETDAFLAVELVTDVCLVVLAACGGYRVTNELVKEAGPSGWIALVVEPVVMIAAFFLVFFLVPWCLSRVTGERFLARTWPAIELLMRLARPYLALARRADAFLHRLWGLKEPGENKLETLTREIRSVVELGQREGVIAAQARRMIERVIALQQDDVAAVMTPRTNMDCVEASSSLDEARRRLVEAGHSRMPLIGNSTDDIVGILYAKDLLRHLCNGAEEANLKLRDIVREPFYVPETTGIDKLLENLKRRRVHIAIVLDEYGGVAGLVTMEDVLEQIVGEIVDEYDTAEDSGIRQILPGSVEVAAWVRIDDLDEQFGFDLPDDEDYDTIGGFLYAQLGRVPKKRDVLNWRQLRFTVLEADKRRIQRIRIDTAASQAAKAGEPA